MPYEKALDGTGKQEKEGQRFFEAAESMFAEEKRKDSVRLPDNIPPERQTNTETEIEGGSAGPVSSSAGAYREINRTLGSIYEPRTDPEKERLLERIEELERIRNAAETEASCQAWEEKIGPDGKILRTGRHNTITVRQWETPLPSEKRRSKKAMKVKQVHNEVVSSLSRPMSDEEFISAFSGIRNAGFNTAVGRKAVTEGKSIAACVRRLPTVSDGQALRLRLSLSPCPLPDVSYRRDPPRSGRWHTRTAGVNGWKSWSMPWITEGTLLAGGTGRL